jgi:hypothetical protein
MPAFPVYVPIIARECVEKFGDLKKPEADVGTGPCRPQPTLLPARRAGLHWLRFRN